jgi:hypothetical protein
LLNPEKTDNEGEETQGQNRNPGERDVGIQVPEWLQEIRRRLAVTKATKPAPINLMKGLDPYNIEDAMVGMKPEISFPQLLDVSPRLRREFAMPL